MSEPTKFNYTFAKVPNNKAGRAFLKNVRKYLNPSIRIAKVRGNGPRAAPADADGVHRMSYRQDLPMRHAKSMRVYLTCSAEKIWWEQRCRTEWEGRAMADDALASMRRQRDALQTSCDSFAASNEAFIATTVRGLRDAYNAVNRERAVAMKQCDEKDAMLRNFRAELIRYGKARCEWNAQWFVRLYRFCSLPIGVLLLNKNARRRIMGDWRAPV